MACSHVYCADKVHPQVRKVVENVSFERMPNDHIVEVCRKLDVCGVGTYFDHDEKKCVPRADVRCAAGTHLENAQCVADVPKCARDSHYDDEKKACVPTASICERGTHFDRGKCVADALVCVSGTHYDREEHACVADTSCVRGSHYDHAKRECVRTASICARGTRYDDGKCVPVMGCH